MYKNQTDFDNLLWDTLQKHKDHHVYIAVYGDENNPANVALECEDCGEIILDAELYTLTTRKNT